MDAIITKVGDAGATSMQLSFLEDLKSWIEPISAVNKVIRVDDQPMSFDISVEVEDSLQNILAQARTFLLMKKLNPAAIKLHEAYVDYVQPNDFSVWIKLGPTNVDAGVLYKISSLDASTLDVMLPQTTDSTTVIDFAFDQEWAAKLFGASIFMNGETRVTFGSCPSQLISSLFFFRELGFQKPPDSLVDAVASANIELFYVHLSLGPHGLLRLSVELKDPSFETLTTMATIVCSDTIPIPRNFSSVEYVGTAHGFGLSVAQPLVV